MIRISLGYIFRLSERLHPITQLQGQKNLTEIYSIILLGYQLLPELINGSVFNFKTCYQSAENLFALLEKKINLAKEQLDIVIPGEDITILAQAAQAFEMALNDEFGAMPSYLVTPKGGYDVNVLTLAAHQLFPFDLIKLVPETKYDVEQVGKCLAFEVPTAAGFHLHRINESVLRHYWDIVTQGVERPKQRNMGVYLTELKRRRKGEAKVKATLQQIKDLHRNPILHPEQILTLEEALELHGIIVSVVSRMLNTIRDKVSKK